MRSTYDIPLPDDTNDEQYLALLRSWLPRLMLQHRPQLIFFQAGVDALKGDRWAARGAAQAIAGIRLPSCCMHVWTFTCMVFSSQACAAVLQRTHPDAGCGYTHG